MKNMILALCLVTGASAFAYMGYPPRSEMNQVTIQKMTAMVIAKGQIGSRFAVETVRMNNKYRLTTPNGCSYIANIQWGEFGWPDVDRVKLKIEGCY